MKLRRGRGYRRGRIEIIPMIDVMFFLLVSFMPRRAGVEHFLIAVKRE